MSLVNAIQISPDKAAESFPEPKKHSKISYTREFLLSLSGLDVCKNLPSGFDRSTPSEFEDAFQAIQDRQRIQGYGCTEYGTTPPTRGDSSNYSRGSYGRWDNHSSGRNERDSDSQSDWDSDSGRRHSNQSRWSWQNSEHDGLIIAPAVPHSRRENSDSFNDEKFGSAECTSQDRAEEERRRRESFELMRKEQQKAFQEKQKLNPNKHKDDHVSDICKLLADTKDGKSVLNRSNELDEIVTQAVSNNPIKKKKKKAVSNNDSSKSSLQTSGARPLVPTGFKSTTLEMNSSTRSLTHSYSAEVQRLAIHHDVSVAPRAVSVPSEEENSADDLLPRRQLQEQSKANGFNDSEGEGDDGDSLEANPNVRDDDVVRVIFKQADLPLVHVQPGTLPTSSVVTISLPLGESGSCVHDDTIAPGSGCDSQASLPFMDGEFTVTCLDDGCVSLVGPDGKERVLDPKVLFVGVRDEYLPRLSFIFFHRPSTFMRLEAMFLRSYLLEAFCDMLSGFHGLTPETSIDTFQSFQAAVVEFQRHEFEVSWLRESLSRMEVQVQNRRHEIELAEMDRALMESASSREKAMVELKRATKVLVDVDLAISSLRERRAVVEAQLVSVQEEAFDLDNQIGPS